MTDLTAKDMAAIRRLARDVADLKRAVRNQARKPQLASSSVEAGAVDMVDSDGTLRGQLGQQWDGTYTASSVNGPVPPTPGGFTVTGHAGFADIAWFGQFVGADDVVDITIVAPQDWSRAEVHVGTTPDFVPVIGPNSTTRRASIESPAGATGAILLDAGDYWVRLVSMTQSGVPSDPSDALAVSVTGATSQADITALQAAQDDLLDSVSTNTDTLTTQDATIASNYNEFLTFQGATNATLGTLQPAFDILSGIGATGIDEDYFLVGDDPTLQTVKLVQVSTFFQNAMGDGDGQTIADDLGLVSAADMGDIEMNTTSTPMTTFYNVFTGSGLSALPWNA